MLRMPYKRYGLDKVMEHIVWYFMNGKAFKGKMYGVWISLPYSDRDKIKRHIKVVIRNELMGITFWKALAKDVFREDGSIDVSSHVYQYFKHMVYDDDDRLMLVKLKDVTTTPVKAGYEWQAGQEDT